MDKLNKERFYNVNFNEFNINYNTILFDNIAKFNNKNNMNFNEMIKNNRKIKNSGILVLFFMKIYDYYNNQDNKFYIKLTENQIYINKIYKKSLNNNKQSKFNK